MPQSVHDPASFQKVLTRNIALPLALGLASASIFVALIFYLLDAIGSVERTDQVITRAYALQKLDLDMETGVRGFLLDGDPSYLEPYDQSLVRLKSSREALATMVQDPAQLRRLERIARLQALWNDFAVEQVRQKRADPDYRIGGRLDQGRRLKQAIREEFEEFVALERQRRLDRVREANRNTIWAVGGFVALMLGMGVLLAWRGRRELTTLSHTYEAALAELERQAADLQGQAWLREGQSLLGERLAQEETLAGICHGALEFLAGYTGGVVAALYVPHEGGGFGREAVWGWPNEAQVPGEQLDSGRTLVAEAAAQRRLIVLDEVPQGYLRVSSGLGEATVRSAVISPVIHERRLCGVIEIGFLGTAQPRAGELLRLSGGILGSAIEAARYQQRLQNMLEETQQLNEEMQVQQEELRTANEELEEQSRALKESQAQLESQQAELEQTNVQLGEFAQRMEDQRDQLREAQAELQQRARDLEKASRYKSEFLANMSHELRTPLNSSLILARLLADNPQGNLSEEQIKYAESIYSAGNDLLTLINDILDIAKVEAGKLQVHPETAALEPVAAGLRAMFEPLATRKGLNLEVLVAGDAPASIVTDRQRLEQILKNLLSNAIKFTDHGSVALHVTGRPGGVAFEVRDTGIGIPSSQQELIFEAFRQADGTDSRRHGGTGLGLSISQDLARLLGGSISLASQPGQGSTFTLEMPLQFEPRAAATPVESTPGADRPAPTAAPAAAPRAAPLPPSPTPSRAPPAFADDRDRLDEHARKVLVVEDDPAFARILYELAHELHYQCLVTHHADEGCELAMRLRPDAVLLDMRLPDDSGLTVLQRLKEDARTRHIPVHVISVEDRAETALQMGAIGYAVKPASREQLREVFERLEHKLSQKVKRVLLVEDDPRQQESVTHLIGDTDVQIVAVSQGQQALAALADTVFDCMIIDLKLPDMSGQELLRRMASGESRSFPPVIVYTGRNLTREEEAELLRYSRSIIIKGARSPERLLDEVTLFLHKVESNLSSERQRMLRTARNRDKVFEDRRILVVDDDVRNIFALTSALEQKGARIEVARNGREALEKLSADGEIDLVLMDIMMPEMDGYTAMREIRRNPRWQRLPIIAITAKAMKEDQDRCLAAGANDYLAKPIELERLFSLIRVWMPKLERI